MQGLIVKWSTSSDCRSSPREIDRHLVERIAGLGYVAVALPMPRGDEHRLIDLGRRITWDEARMVAAAVAAGACVEYADPDSTFGIATLTTDDPYLSSQWYLSDATGGIDLVPEWGLYPTVTTPVRVAVIDSGYTMHPDMGASSGDLDYGTWARWGVCDNTTNDYLSSWHGTRVASVINAQLSNYRTGMVGVAGHYAVAGGFATPTVTTQHYKVIRTCDVTAESDIVAAINKAVSDAKSVGVRQVLNLSLAAPVPCSSAMQSAISAAAAADMPVVVAAGNGGASVTGYSPANCRSVLVVAATTKAGGRAWYSNFGTAVGLSAPGGDAVWLASDNDILTARNPATKSAAPIYASGYDWIHPYDTVSGTSMSAPMVSATLAMIFAASPSMSAVDAISLVKSTARPFPQVCSGCGTGILDIKAALAQFQPKSGIGTPDCKTNPSLCR